MLSKILHFFAKGKRFRWLLPLMEVVVWTSLIAFVGLRWTLIALALLKILLWIYLWCRWQQEAKLVSSRLSAIATSKKKQAKAEVSAVYQKDWFKNESFRLSVFFSLCPFFMSFLIVAFFFWIGRESVVSEAANDIAKREKAKRKR